MDPSLGAASALPYLPMMLRHGESELPVSGLVDSGATLNVLPYEVGLCLGAVWERQALPIRLAGNMEARGLLLTASLGRFAPVRLAFAWTRSNRVPVILGQVNFFMAFDIHFCRSELFFDISLRRSPTAG
ncbi:MAG: hypothetical protein ACOCWL_01775 [Thermoguttaceae bacterium]